MVLVFRCWKAASRRHILVREFSTLPLLFISPLLWPLRKKIYFLMHHNLQWAARSRIEDFGLTALNRMGLRWAIFETQDFPMFGSERSGRGSAIAGQRPEGEAKFCIPSHRNLMLPHPVLKDFSNVRKKSAPPVIGVVGYYRPEKGMDELLRLLTEKLPDCDIIAGVPNPKAVKISSVKILNTASDESYRRMLAQCDVLVQNGARDSYFYRVSGPVADAAACGTAVVVPDFPLLRHQISSPVPVGEVFQCLEKLPEAVRTAVAKARTGEYDFRAYCDARSAQALADQLDAFSRRQNG